MVYKGRKAGSEQKEWCVCVSTTFTRNSPLEDVPEGSKKIAGPSGLMRGGSGLRWLGEIGGSASLMTTTRISPSFCSLVERSHLAGGRAEILAFQDNLLPCRRGRSRHCFFDTGALAFSWCYLLRNWCNIFLQRKRLLKLLVPFDTSSNRRSCIKFYDEK